MTTNDNKPPTTLNPTQQKAPPAPANTPPATTISPELEAHILALAKVIQQTLITSSGGIQGVMELPAKVSDFKMLTLAMERILAANFKILLKRADKGRLKLGASISFQSPSADDLRDRYIKIDLTSTPRKIVINGLQPENGANAYTELSFDWEKRSCTINENGSIDWKNINSIPSVGRDQLLVTFHDRTPGQPGVDCYGKAIRQKPGSRHPIRWNKKNIFRRDDPDDPTIFRLFSAAPGAVDFTFSQAGNPKTLNSLKITDTLTVSGDINYDYGDIQSSASLEIHGSLKGNFSLHSDGHVYVQESIEGKEIEAKGIKAQLITNGCNVFAHEEIETANINNGFANAENIIIKKTASGAELKARKQITFLENSSFLGIRMHARVIVLNKVQFSGINEIYLGEKLFKEARFALQTVAESNGDLEIAAAKGKTCATTMLTLLIQLEKFTKGEGPESIIRKMINGLKVALITAFKTISTIDKKVTALCYKLQEKIGENKYNESVMRKVDHIVSQIKVYNSVQAELAEIGNNTLKYRRKLQSLSTEIKTGLFVELDQSAARGNNAELKISCGEAYKVIGETNFTGKQSMIIRYVVPEDAESLEDGELVIET